MIFNALSTVADELNQFFRNKFSQTEDKVILANLINQDGSLALTESDKVIMTLVNIQQERSTASSRQESSIKINLYVLFTAYFTGKNYPESLKFLSAILGFFQANNVMDGQNTPNLDSDIEKLTFEIENMTIPDLSNLWGSLGGKYLPSVVYKVRLLAITENTVSIESPRLGLSQK
ncbi:MAG: DUF4255 domain-containing protein [Bacteroidetes bacterium]|nr:MAG: DUF4255 domain-containing protein [Bacteroidota bacterium]